MSIQQLMLGAGGAAKKTYLDEVFSTYLWKGTGSARSINNGIDLATEGGMSWIKKRSGSDRNVVTDTVRGVTKQLFTERTDGESTDSDNITSFNNNGFSLDTDNRINQSGATYSSWSFRKSPGFFDVVTWTGNGSARTIAHSLGSVPGMIMVKQTSSVNEWVVYQKDLGTNKFLMLQSGDAALTSTAVWNDTAPTATHFSVGAAPDANSGAHRANTNGASYVAYVFAGGESTAATARSITFPNTASVAPLEASTSHDRTGYDFGTGDFTIECWFKYGDNSSNILVDKRTSSNTTDVVLYIDNNNAAFFQGGSNRITSYNLSKQEWYHLALVRSSGTTKMYVNGIFQGSYADTTDYDSTAFHIGGEDNGANCLNGSISNLRVVKGTAVYTSSFRPPTEPLTNITNTVLLCCNNSSITGTTVGNIQEGSSGAGAAASTDSPFDDPAGFVFGDSKESVIKCGSYVGNGASTSVEVGFEPQFILIKKSSSTADWYMVDSMRGLVTGGNDPFLYPNGNWSEDTYNFIKVTPTGFSFEGASSALNGSGASFIYCAIRRPDGYVGKPVETATSVFAMDTGAGDTSTTIPNYDSGFPVDFALSKKPASTSDWLANGRLIGIKELAPNTSGSEAQDSSYVWDSNVGWGNGAWQDSTYQSWMWKRHAGMDVVCWTGNGSARQIPHNLSKSPEMFWVKKRGGDTSNWAVYHKGLNGGTNPEQYYINLDESSAENTNSGLWNNTAPTSTHFSLGTSNSVSENTHTFIAMLFASVDGVSKVGYFNDSGSQTITTGFQPRFLILRPTASNDWFMFDTTRGWSSGNDEALKLNSSNAQAATWDVGAPTSTGFTVVGAYNWGNTIYYAHA